MEGKHSGAVRAASVMLGVLALAAAMPCHAAPRAPYPPSRYVSGIHWDFRGAKPLRHAIGSDIWPCTWARDGALYCAWGDGGGFDGNSNTTGRVSVGFARVIGKPRAGRASSFHGKNIWGAPPYAEQRATFGGKVGTLIAAGGTIYAWGSLWTRQNAEHPEATSGPGTLDRLIWSADSGRTWQIASWSPHEDLGSFLNFGRGDANAPNGYIYSYFSRAHDPSHIYLKRVPARELTAAPGESHAWQYLAFTNRSGDAVSWSPRTVDAIPVFADAANAIGPSVVYDAGIGRYLMTLGHNATGRPADDSPGKLGVFAAPHPWGPWRTLYYGDDWGHFPASTRGDYLGLRFPAKWISDHGTRLWGVFSGPGELDAFNLVEAHLIVRRRTRTRTAALARCRERYNAVNGSVFMVCRDSRPRPARARASRRDR